MNLNDKVTQYKSDPFNALLPGNSPVEPKFSVQEVPQELLIDLQTQINSGSIGAGASLLIGHPGCGKTDVIRNKLLRLLHEWAVVNYDPYRKWITENDKDVKNKNIKIEDTHLRPGFITRIISQEDNSDSSLPCLVGTGKDVKYMKLAPSQFEEAFECPVGIMFLDELGDGDRLVTATVSNQLLDGVIGNLQMPIGWSRIGAMNPAGTGASSTGLPNQLHNRLKNYIIYNPFEAWYNWALSYGDLHPDLAFFFNSQEINKDYLHIYNYKDLKKDVIPVFPSHRTWMAVNRYLHNTTHPENRLRRLAGMIGPEMALEFESQGALEDYWGKEPNRITLEKVLKDPAHAPIPKNEQAAIFYALVAQIVSAATNKNMSQIVTYGRRLPGEIQGLMMPALRNKNQALPKDQKILNSDFKEWVLKEGAELFNN
jgi:hypothetical protein